jgi:tetratricopeptide (TPR) repeat protein
MVLALCACQTITDIIPGANAPGTSATGESQEASDASRVSPDRQVAEAHFRLGKGLEEAGDLVGATADYEAAAALGSWPVSAGGSPDEATPQAALARICDGDNPPGVVLRACTAVLAELRYTPERLAGFLARRAETELSLGDPEQALASLDAAQKLSSGHPEHLVLRGRVLEELGQDRQAQISYDRALFGRPGYAEALLRRGRLLARMGFAEDAEKNFDAVLSDPKASAEYPDAYRDRALLHCRLGRAEEAAVGFRVWADLSPGGPDALRNELETHGRLRNPAVAGGDRTEHAALTGWIAEGCPD